LALNSAGARPEDTPRLELSSTEVASIKGAEARLVGSRKNGGTKQASQREEHGGGVGDTGNQKPKG